jgi:hypothetical protein
MLSLFRRLTLAVSVVAALVASGSVAASAQAKKLVLSTAGQGPVSSLEGTMTTTAGSLSLEGEECGTRWPGILKLKIKINESGNGFTGSASEQNAFSCALPSGAGVTIEPDPHPWSVKLSPSGKGQLKGEEQKLELLASIGGEECVYASGKINLRYVVAGPLHPVPLEPGDPVAVRYKLSRAISGAACPRSAGETLMFNVTTGDPAAGEEQVFDE